MKKFSLILTLLFVIISITHFAYAQSTGTIGSAGTSSCPQIFTVDPATNTQKSISLNDYLNQGTNLSGTNNNPNNPDSSTVTISYGNGVTQTYPSRADAIKAIQAQYTSFSCPPRIGDLQTLFLRLITILNTVVGLVLLFVIARAGLTRATAQGDMDKVKKSMEQIRGGIIGVIIVLSGYLLLVFIGTIVLPADPCYRYSFIDTGKILFTFDQSDISPVLVDTKTNPSCATTP